MKKIFSFNIPNKKRERQIDSIKYEIKKYIARERRKKLPENIDYWDFDCRIGVTAEEASVIHLNDINSSISKIAEEQEDSFYIEVLVKPGVRKKKPSTEEKKTDSE